MLYKVLSLHDQEENALFFSVQRPSRRLSLVDLICVLYRIGPCSLSRVTPRILIDRRNSILALLKNKE